MRLTRRTTCTLFGVLIFIAIFVLFSGSVFATTFYSTNTSTSVGSPITNALALSSRAFPSGAPAAVVANADDWASTAGAGVLARAYEGPLLLSSSASATGSVVTELKRLRPGTVYVVGLSAAVAAQIDAALAVVSPRPQVVTLTGADAYATAALVAGQVKQKLGTVSRVVIVPSDDSSGVLAGSAMAAANGWPILLTPVAGPFSQVSAAAITELGVSSGICVGTSVTPTNAGFVVEKTLVATDTTGRYGLCAKTAEYAVTKGYSSYARVGVVGAYDILGGQVVSAYVASGDGVLLLSLSYALAGTTKTVMQTHGREMAQVDAVGLAWSIVREIKSLNSPRVTAVSPSSGPLAGGTTVVVTGTGLDAASSVVMGKTSLPASDWRVDSSTQLTILSTPAASTSVPVEVIVNNYWGRGPANGKAVFRYVYPGPAMPGDRVVAEAVKHLGVPYVWAGSTPWGGFDCSGFTMYVYKQLGVTLPHKASIQAGYGWPVSKDALLPGDLVFFSNPVSHVGIYVGDGLMINAPRSGDLVTIENVYRSSFVSARRIFWPYTRYQDNNAMVVALGSWNTASSSTASGGSLRWLGSSGSMTVKFNGTYLAWLGKKGVQYGIAEVALDGGTPTTVDLYSATTQNQTSLWNTGMLSPGEHTVTIAWTGTKNAAASASYVGVDAFDLLGSLVQAPGPARYQQSDSRLTLAGSWWTGYSIYASAGSFYYGDATAKATVYFDGTYLAWVAKKSSVYGKAKVTLDGGSPVLVDLYSPTALYKQPVYNTGMLSDGTHTLLIESTGTKNAAANGYYIGVDAIDVLGELTQGAVPPTGSGVTRYEQTDSRLGYIDSWQTTTDAAASAGDSADTNAAGELVACFKGASLTWIAKKSPASGIARVTVDNKAPVQVDLYSPTTLSQQSVYVIGNLADGDHTLTIEWTGTKNAAATGSSIGVDAFDIVGALAQAPSLSRFEQDASQIAYAGPWQPVGGGAYTSGGSAIFANTYGCSATVSFSGNYIAWIAKKSSVYGKAMVFLDDKAPVAVDLYSPTSLFQQRVWNSGILPAGPHTLTIQWSWGRNKSATDTNLSMDAFEVLGTLTQAASTVKHSEAKSVMIDPGHQLYANTSPEPVGPGSATTKDKVSSGTASVNTGSPESALVLQVGLKLRAELQKYGLDVQMTRETQSVNISNAQRAQLANAADADLFVRIHADGSTDQSVNGILMLYPATIQGWTDDIAAESLRGATIALQELTKATGAKSRGLSARSDLAGFNWSDVPTFLPEIGLMTNPTEDALLATDAYQNKIVTGLTKAILCFLDIY